MNITLSTPSTISSKVNEASAAHAFGSVRSVNTTFSAGEPFYSPPVASKRPE